MKRLLLPALFLVSFGVVGAGCGGSGSGSSNGITTLSLTADHTTITPGQTVNLSWSSQNARFVATSNFGANAVSGTLAVTPTFSSDYALTVNGQPNQTASVHVTVTRPQPRFIIVGNAASPDVPQIQTLLGHVGAVTVQTTMPSSPSSYDAVVIHGSGTISPADQSTVTAALAAGKGVVLLGLAPSELATGISAYTTNGTATDSTLDTSAISSWFGGITELDRQAYGIFTSGVNMAYFALPATIDFSTQVYTTAGSGTDNTLGYAPSGLVGSSCYPTLNQTTINPLETIGFAFKEPGGGRLYWQWHYLGSVAASQAVVSGIFTDGCLWAASQ